MIAVCKKLLLRANRVSFARGSVSLRGARLRACTLDRLLYLWLNRLGVMGAGVESLRHEIRPGMTVVDIGANVGVYTALFSELVGRTGKVISLEPAPDNWRSLSEAVEINGWSNVELHQVAAAEKHGSMALVCSAYNSGNNALGCGAADGPAVAVKVAPLDSIIAGRKVDFIKIDVQGWEAAVLRGARETLTANRPLVVRLEVWPKGLRRANSSPREVSELLAKCGLQIDAADQSRMISEFSAGYFDITARA